MLVLEKQVQEKVKGTRELTGGWLEGFSEPRSETFPCQNQGSLGGINFLRWVHFLMHLLIFKFHDWSW